MAKHRLLVVDDERNICRSIEMICSGEGYEVHTAADSGAMWDHLSQQPIELMLLDIHLQEANGIELLQQVREKFPDLIVLMISGHATVEVAVQATKHGAYDFIEKPIFKDRLLLAIKNALQSRQLREENLALRHQVSGKYVIIGQSRAIQNVLRQIARVAPSEGRVLILGESGTGKELIARAIHAQSRRREQPFVRVNCAAIPEELIESELFGSVKGAYTGAMSSREGKFSLADGGTLFLDEVGDMSLKVQAKVLRVLQEGEFEKVGGQTTEKVDVRILAATNKDLEAEVAQGRFREDLLFRLNVIPIVSPPLRERREDVPILIEHFAATYCHENGCAKFQIAPEAMNALVRYHWPGNIRELQNLVERLIIMNRHDVVKVDDLPSHIFRQPATPAAAVRGLSLKAFREKVEKDYILSTLEEYDWNISQAARVLEIDRTNLHKKMRAWKLFKGANRQAHSESS